MSGKTVGHRSQSRFGGNLSRVPASRLVNAKPLPTQLASPSSSNKPSTHVRSTQQLSIRRGDEQGLIGISEREQRVLRVVEKKIMKMEIRAQNEYQRKVERSGNKQKFFRVRSRRIKGSKKTRILY